MSLYKRSSFDKVLCKIYFWWEINGKFQFYSKKLVSFLTTISGQTIINYYIIIFQAKVGFVERPHTYRRIIWRWKNGRWFRIRPTTHDSISNCNEQCQERRNRRNKNIKNDELPKSKIAHEDYDTCKTISGPQTNQECKFPVTFRGKKYETCISGNKRRRPWCSTGLNANGEYVSKMWGFCNTSNCPLPEEA